jgi:NAD-dependent SIR2 family protein deacetylase
VEEDDAAGSVRAGCERAATLLREASGTRALVVAAGAGMGVDSGLPDFRGNEGFWKAYPPFAKLGLSFVALANPRWFETDPELAWGFYGHRLNLYRRVAPHEGYGILARWGARMAEGAFVFTSNVDGHFAKAGFAGDRIHECHGSIHLAQCTSACGEPAFAPPAEGIDVDESTMRARGPLPSCPRCGALARPAILMFGDGDWDSTHFDAQERRLDAWLRRIPLSKVVVVECGAGKAVPTVRYFSERLVAGGARLVRINVREPDVPPHQIGISGGALQTLRAIDALI